MKKPSKPSLRQINWCLAGLIVAINLYVIALPLWPALQFWFVERTDQTTSTHLDEEAKNSPPENYKSNTIIIPRLKLKETIFEGPDISAANKGIWRRPNSSSPPKKSNTVLAGHRFMYNNPKGVFYHLDKLKLGDELTVFWKQQRYVYQVNDIRTVSAKQSSVEKPTDNALLTLYTCTPLWSAKDRLVVTAILIEHPPEPRRKGAIYD